MAVTVQLGNATQVNLRVLDSEAIHHATGHSGQEALQQILIQCHTPVLLRLVQAIWDLVLTLPSCRRRILDTGLLVTVCADYKVFADPHDKLLHGS